MLGWIANLGFAGGGTAAPYLANVVPVRVTADGANGLVPVYQVLSGGVPVQVTTNDMNGLVPVKVVADGAGVPVIVLSGALS